MPPVRTSLVPLFALFMLLPALASAQAPAPPAGELTLESAIAIAMRNNHEVRNALLEVDKSENRLAAGRTERWPHLRVGLEQVYLLAPIDLTFGSGVFGTVPGVGAIPPTETVIRTSQGWTTAVSASAVQPIAGLYRIGLGIERLEVGREIRREQLRDRRLTVTNDVKRAYYGALQTEGSLEAIGEAVTFYRELLRVVEGNVRQQAALPADALDVKARLARAEYMATTLRHSLASRREELNQLLGRDVSTEFRLVPVGGPSSLELDLPVARARALRQRPEITSGKLSVKEADYAVRMKSAEYIPDFNLVLRYFSPITGDTLPRHIAYAGFELSWDIWDWGRKSQEMAERKRAVEQATNRLANLEPQITREVNDGYRRLHEARLLLDVTRVTVEAEREKQRVALDRYRQQMALLRDTLQAQTAVAEANQQHQAALLAFWTARADFERALGEE